MDVLKVYCRHSVSDINSICQPPSKHSLSGLFMPGTLSLGFKLYF